jgi:hypothetical protein
MSDPVWGLALPVRDEACVPSQISLGTTDPRIAKQVAEITLTRLEIQRPEQPSAKAAVMPMAARTLGEGGVAHVFAGRKPCSCYALYAMCECW